METPPADRVKRILGTALAYLLWLAASALALVDLMVARTCYLVLMGVAGLGQWTARFFDKALFILAAIALLALIFAVEYYFVNGLRTGRLMKRVARVAGVELLLLAGFQLTVDIAVGRLAPSGLGRVVGIAAGCGGLALLILSLLHAQRAPR